MGKKIYTACEARRYTLPLVFSLDKLTLTLCLSLIICEIRVYPKWFLRNLNEEVCAREIYLREMSHICTLNFLRSHVREIQFYITQCTQNILVPEQNHNIKLMRKFLAFYSKSWLAWMCLSDNSSPLPVPVWLGATEVGKDRRLGKL